MNYDEFLAAAYKYYLRIKGHLRPVKLSSEVFKIPKHHYNIVDELDENEVYVFEERECVGEYSMSPIESVSLNSFLFDLVPNLPLEKYIKIRELIVWDVDYEFDWYDTKSIYIIQTIELRKVFDFLKELGELK